MENIPSQARSATTSNAHRVTSLGAAEISARSEAVASGDRRLRDDVLGEVLEVDPAAHEGRQLDAYVLGHGSLGDKMKFEGLERRGGRFLLELPFEGAEEQGDGEAVLQLEGLETLGVEGLAHSFGPGTTKHCVGQRKTLEAWEDDAGFAAAGE